MYKKIEVLQIKDIYKYFSMEIFHSLLYGNATLVSFITSPWLWRHEVKRKISGNSIRKQSIETTICLIIKERIQSLFHRKTFILYNETLYSASIQLAYIIGLIEWVVLMYFNLFYFMVFNIFSK